MKRKFRKKPVSVILIISIVLSYCAFSSAYIYYNVGNISPSFDIENYLSRPAIASSARSAWNVTPTPVWITEVTGSGHSWEIDDYYGTDWTGLYTAITRQYVFWGRATKFRIQLNRSILEGESDNYWKSTLVHEFGHALCLGDDPNPSVPGSSIMNRNRNRETVNIPQTDDINGVNYAY